MVAFRAVLPRSLAATIPPSRLRALLAALGAESPLTEDMNALPTPLPPADLVPGSEKYLVGEEGVAGKSLGTDLAKGKLTLPVLLLWMVYRLGYDRRAWLAQTLLCLAVLPATYWLTKPADNINWVYGPGSNPQQRLPPLLYLGLLMTFFPLIVYLPTHWILLRCFRRA